MNCVRCGKQISGKPVLAIYADPGFEDKEQGAFPLDADCFEEDRRVTVQQWSDAKQEHEDITITRYRKATKDEIARSRMLD